VSYSTSWVRRRIDPIGIDFGKRHIRMLQLARQRGHLTVIGFAECAVPAQIHSPLDYIEFQKKVVPEMLEEGGFVGREVVSALSWEDLQIRNLRIPPMPEDEAVEVVRFDAADRFGLNPNDAEIRHIVAGDVRQGTEIQQEVIALGASRASVDAHIEMLTKLGLTPVAIEVGPCAIFRPFERFLQREDDNNDVNVFIDLGYKASRVVISRGANLIFFKSIPIAGERFDRLVSEKLNLSQEEASQVRMRLKRKHVAVLTGQTDHLDKDESLGDNMQRAILDTLRQALEQLGKEIGLCLRYCSVTFRGLRSDTVTAVGGEAYDADILRLLSDHVGVPFRIGKPLHNVSSDCDFCGADRRAGQPEWTTALGLALKSMGQLAEVAS